jgi:predicted ABC-type exoprotein transport system permease subunit
MSNWIVALLLALGASTWIYSKLMRSTGNNAKSSIIGASAVGLLLFFVVAVTLGFLGLK